MDLNQPEQLTKEEEDQNSSVVIGGIQVLLPISQEESEICIADVEAATTRERQLAETVKEELE